MKTVFSVHIPNLWVFWFSYSVLDNSKQPTSLPPMNLLENTSGSEWVSDPFPTTADAIMLSSFLLMLGLLIMFILVVCHSALYTKSFCFIGIMAAHSQELNSCLHPHPLTPVLFSNPQILCISFPFSHNPHTYHDWSVVISAMVFYVWCDDSTLALSISIQPSCDACLVTSSSARPLSWFVCSVTISSQTNSRHPTCPSLSSRLPLHSYVHTASNVCWSRLLSEPALTHWLHIHISVISASYILATIHVLAHTGLRVLPIHTCACSGIGMIHGTSRTYIAIRRSETHSFTLFISLFCRQICKWVWLCILV